MARYMLDTDTVMYLIRGRTPALDARVAAAAPAQLCISAITRGELLCGLSRQRLQGCDRASRLPLESVLKDWLQAVPIEQASAELLRHTTRSALAQLTPDQAAKRRRRVRLYTKLPLTLEDVGRQFDVQRERIAQGPTYHWSQVVDQFLARVPCLPWDEAAATHFAAVAAELHRGGEGVGSTFGSLDMMIAGHAIAAGAVLVTTHERELGRITGLQVENWTRGRRNSPA
jgi:predicted nucleic acid-binding protein